MVFLAFIPTGLLAFGGGVDYGWVWIPIGCVLAAAIIALSARAIWHAAEA